jgi:SAM-dependent methyltransferase
MAAAAHAQTAGTMEIRAPGFVRWLLLPWPLPALVAWLAAWASWIAAAAAGVPSALAWACACAVGIALAALNVQAWRRLIAAAGFPVASLLLGAALPGWAWLLALAPLALLYPVRAWRDAPLFPTPASALEGLARAVAEPAPQRVLDAGCGLGHGLAALRAQWPAAHFTGIEASRALAGACAARCRFAEVRRGDIWAADWRGFDLVYLFQRPESMARAWAQAQAQLAPGAWLVSLEFEVPGVKPTAVLRAETAARPVWLYRITRSTGPAGGR